MASPRPVQAATNGFIHLRPLLDLRRSEIVLALQNCGISWREDSSNEEALYFRNRIRNTVIPAWEVASPQDLFDGLSTSRQILEDEDEALNEWLFELVGKIDPEEPLDLGLLKDKPKALYRRALQVWIGSLKQGGALGRLAVEELIQKMMNGRKGQQSFGSSSFLEYEDRVIRLISPSIEEAKWLEKKLVLGGEVQCLDQSERIVAKAVEVDDALRAKILAGEFCPSETVFLALGMKAEPVFCVREWRNGDAYQPLGSPGTAKLQDLFTNKKIPVKKRHQLPIVCLASGRLIWCPYFPPSHLYRIKQSTKRAVQLTYLV
ncbi:MAG: tRNA lysidine(34) synthetase TilS [Opitutaceae bacterium]|nr:tRNA lysidine(34) synthetase TilS [Opitutaceae bacterium]